MSTLKDTALAILLPAVIGALSATLVGGLNYFNRDKELDIQLVNVGLSIMRGEATGEKDTLQARKFALRLLKTYAKVEIPQDEFDEWASKGITPFSPTNNFSSIIDNLVGIKYKNGIELGMAGCLKIKDHVKNPGQRKLDPYETPPILTLETEQQEQLCKRIIERQIEELNNALRSLRGG